MQYEDIPQNQSIGWLNEFQDLDSFYKRPLLEKKNLTDTGRARDLSTGEKVQKWTHYFLLFFPTRPSDEYDSAPSRKNSRPLLEVFACIG